MKVAHITGFIALISTQSALAGEPAPRAVELHGEVKLVRVVIEDGKERQVLAEPKVVVPGDRLVFSTRYHNAGAAPVGNFELTNPLPAAVMLDPAEPASGEVSVDGGKEWGRLGALTVPNGTGGTRPATAADVTHLRWKLPTLAPGATGTLTYHAVVR